MPTTRIQHVLMPLMLASLLPLVALPASAKNTGVDREISADLAEARKEVRAELGDNLRFGKSDKRRAAQDPLPKAEITPQGDLLIEGKAVAIDGHQRQELLRYRGQVIDIAKAGIDIGERSAQAALEAVDRGVFSLMLGAMTGSLERRVEKTVRETVEPGVRQICRSLPALRDTQQRLSASLPQFRPYATLDVDDAENCEKDVRREFATR